MLFSAHSIGKEGTPLRKLLTMETQTPSRSHKKDVHGRRGANSFGVLTNAPLPFLGHHVKFGTWTRMRTEPADLKP